MAIKIKGLPETDFERETKLEIDHDSHKPKHQKRRNGGKASGNPARARFDRPSRAPVAALRLGGMAGTPLRPGLGGLPIGSAAPGVGATMPTRIAPRPLNNVAPPIAAAAAPRTGGFRRGGRARSRWGQKWEPGQGVEDTSAMTKSRGTPALEDTDDDGMKRGGRKKAC